MGRRAREYTAVANASVRLVQSLGPKVSVGAAVFPGPQVSLAHACLAGEEVFKTTPGQPTPAGRAMTRTGHPAFSRAISLPAGSAPVGSTPTAATLNAILPGLAALPGQTAVVLATDGGPNCNATANCDEANCIPNIEHDPPGCTTGVNCCTEAIAGPDASRNCLDSLATKNAVMALHDKGIKTFVVGVPGSSPYAALLDDLAVAGGTARLGTTAYYDVEAHLGARRRARSDRRNGHLATCTSISRPPITIWSTCTSTRAFDLRRRRRLEMDRRRRWRHSGERRR